MVKRESASRPYLCLVSFRQFNRDTGRNKLYFSGSKTHGRLQVRKDIGSCRTCAFVFRDICFRGQSNFYGDHMLPFLFLFDIHLLKIKNILIIFSN